MAQAPAYGPVVWAREAFARGERRRKRREQLRAISPIVGWLVVAAAAVVTELTIPGLRGWYVERPVTAGIISGGIVLAPLVYLVERWTARRDQLARAAARERALEEWREPAREVIETYMDACFEAIEVIERELRNGAAVLKREQLAVEDLPDLVAHGGWFVEFRAELVVRARLGNGIALALVPAVAPYPPLTRFVEPIVLHQRRLRHSASLARFIDSRSLPEEIGGASPDVLRSDARRLGSLLSAWASGVYDLQGELRAADDDLRLPPEQRRYLRSAPAE